LEQTTYIGEMIGRLGIDMAYAALPRYGLAFSSALRACNSCTARAQCAQWLAKTRDTAFGPPKFCANADLLWELLCDPTIGHHPSPSNDRTHPPSVAPTRMTDTLGKSP
jgi:hypothetical protein